MGYIYCITNNINGKKYIGQTKFDDDRRIKEHLNEATNGNKNLHLYNSIRKYGWQNFNTEILKSNLSECELDMWEIYYIGKYDTYNNGYNNTLGGGGIRGYHHTEETKLKISKNQNPNIYTDERAAKISRALSGRPKSIEHRKKLSESRLGKYTKTDNGFYGKHHKEETLQRNREAHIKYVFHQVDLSSGEIINSFYDIRDIVQYISKNNLSNAKDTSIKYRIYATIEGRQKEAYGYGWIGEKV
jgi:group I intron endonuclease